MQDRNRRRELSIALTATLLALAAAALPAGAQEDDAEEIDSSSCVGCHEVADNDRPFGEMLDQSTHAGFIECQDCHADKTTYPHQPSPDFAVGMEGCAQCHFEAAEQYQIHGRMEVGASPDMPLCNDCHGDHRILASEQPTSLTNPANLPDTCGRCHEDTDLTARYEILIEHPIGTYLQSVHGRATTEGVYMAASCNDCHSTGGSAHRIYGPGHPDSTINHFNVPATCGKCHPSIENEYWEGIHGKLARRGQVDVPVCTDCHGEHGILPASDPRSPISPAKLAELTCAPCHESVQLAEKYGLPPGRLTSFIDSYHGLKSKAGDTHVANCASCHGVHKILPSTDPESTIHPANLEETCGDCHPNISPELAAQPIHGVGGEGLHAPIADVVENVYIVAIIVIIGMMVLHWLIDFGRYMVELLRKRPQVRRMTTNEVWQHAALALTFIVLVISGFALRFSQSWVSRVFFGWEGGFELRGQVHRIAGVLFMLTVAWHLVYVIVTRRGRRFVIDMLPTWADFRHFWERISYNLGWRKTPPAAGRFTYVEKAEYWALVWGTIVMIVTGMLLWYDNWFIAYLPKGFLDVALVVHYWEAWLATLAIVVWHFYSTIFSPEVYPMNPSWLTGTMPEEMYAHEHPLHLEEARRESQEEVEEQRRRLGGIATPRLEPAEETVDGGGGGHMARARDREDPV
jgi:formate dehydrogenase gamma subunit